MRSGNGRQLHKWLTACCALVGIWLGTGHSAAQEGVPTLSCRLPSAPITVGGQAEVFLEIQNVQNLYGYELVLRYDSTLIEFVDADPAREGVNTQLSNFLSPDFLVLNDVDPPGELWLNLMQIDPTPARSGSSPLARAIVTGRQDGIVNFSVTDLILYDVAGNEIPYQIQNCALQVGTPPSPTATVTLPAATPTLALAPDTPTAIPMDTSTETAVQAPPTVAASATPVPAVIPTAAPTTGAAPPTPSQPTASSTATSLPVPPAAVSPVTAVASAATATVLPTPIAAGAVALTVAPSVPVPVAPAASTLAYTLSLPYINNGIVTDPSALPPQAGIPSVPAVPTPSPSPVGKQASLPLVTVDGTLGATTAAGQQIPAVTAVRPTAVQEQATLSPGSPQLGTDATAAAIAPTAPTGAPSRLLAPDPRLLLSLLFPLGLGASGAGMLGLVVAFILYRQSRYP